MTNAPQVRRRRDAVRNDERILDAAHQVMASTGPDASMEAIATQAGVGVGTIYRSIGNKDLLIEAVLQQMLASIEKAALDAVPSVESGGLEHFLAAVGETLHSAHGYAELWFGREVDVDATERIRAAIGTLEEAAMASGTVAPSTQPGDLLTLVRALAAIIRLGAGRDSWRRFVRVHLAGLRADN